MAQTNAAPGESVDHRTRLSGLRDRDLQRLVAIVSSVLASPLSSLPAWSEGAWRAALRYRDTGPRPAPATLARAEVRDTVLRDPAFGDLLRWAAGRRPLSYQLGAIAAALATLGEAFAGDNLDPNVLAGRVTSAVDQARMLRYSPLPDRAMLTDCADIADPAPIVCGDRPSLVSLVIPRLLDRAGGHLSAHPLLERRIEGAVDVCLGAWLTGVGAGGGMPAFYRAEQRNHRHRVSHLLGADRDLQRLVEGPPPGRGRPLAVARRRGLAYWVALAALAATETRSLPPLPVEVVDHWRRELSRLSGPLEHSGLAAVPVDQRVGFG